MVRNSVPPTRGRVRASPCIATVVLMPCNVALAAGAEHLEVKRKTHAAATAPVPLMTRERATGNWGGARSWLEHRGLRLDAEYVLEASSVLRGGIEEEGSNRNLLTIDADMDLEPLFGLDGGRFFTQLLYVNDERGGSADSGGIQVYSNIESDRELAVIFEMWYEQVFLEDRFRLKVGKLDANSEFAYVNTAGNFAHSSAGFSPTIFVFPSYPDSATSVNAFLTPIRGENVSLTFSYGFYDGALGADGVRTGSLGPSTFLNGDRSGDYFHIAEASLDWKSLGTAPGGRLVVGGWLHTGEFDRYAGGTQEGTEGLYLVAEQRLTAPVGPEGERGWHVFGQYGYAEAQVSEIEHHIGAGVVTRGLWEARPDDEFGIYLSFAGLSEDAIDLEYEPEEPDEEPPPLFHGDEFAADAYYRFQLTPALYLQPEFQYVANPSGDPLIEDAFVGGCRVGITF